MATKKIIHSFCPYCNQPVDSEQLGVEYVKTRRKSEILFHTDCYKRYAVIKHVASGLEEKNEND